MKEKEVVTPRGNAAKFGAMVMSNYAGLGDLVEQIKEASTNIARSDAKFGHRLDALEDGINDLYKRGCRPGAEWRGDDAGRRDAEEMCRIRHFDASPKDDGFRTKEYFPGSGEIDEALAARRGFKQLLRTGDLMKLGELERKSLSAFGFGTNGYLMPATRANTVLSCLTNPSDLSGLVDKISISGPSVKFLIDNARMGMGAWACESSCFANNPQPDLQAGLGELEIKPETLRFVVCATRDLIEDASIDIEAWLTDKIATGMGAVINEALLIGDAVGKPLGLLHPRSAIPICETSVATPPGQFSWQDLVMLRWEIPMQWQAGCAYVMNQRTFSLLATMSDAGGRPLWTTLPGEEPGFRLAGAPIIIATQMPDVAPGSTPVLYGNLKKAYVVVWRKAVTIQTDPYTVGFCFLYKAEARCGGATTCPNAVRLLRIR